MKRLRGLVRLLLLLPLLLPATSLALGSPSGVVISEIQTTGADNVTDQEFVELYNPTDVAIDISSWKFQYLSAAGSSWQTKATLNGWLYPNGRILLASTGFLAETTDISFNPGMKLEAGHVRIVSPDPEDTSSLVIEDLVGWGTALYPETEAATFATAGSSLVRRQDLAGKYQDTNNNELDFETALPPTPESNNVAPNNEELPSDDETPELDPEVIDDQSEESPEEAPVDEEADPELPVEESEQPETEVSEQQESVVNVNLEPIQITELLPNPAAPSVDSDDEYIELYNPNDQVFDLLDYKLQSGSAFSYSYTFDNTQIPPHQYLVLYVSETGLILSNTKGQARLISSNGTVTFQTDPYEAAADGEAWSLIDGVWQWSATPTPGIANVVSPVAAAVTATSAQDAAKKKSTKKKAATTKKATKPKAAKAKKETKKKTAAVAGATDNGDDGSEGNDSPAPIHSMVIAGTGVIAVGYAIYEYKDDILRRFGRFRRNHGFGGNVGPAT